MKKDSLPDRLLRFSLDLLAEMEDRFFDPVKPRPPGFWRRRQLRRMGVTWGEPLCTRPGLFLLRRHNVTLGKRVCLGHHTRFYNHAPITIGDDFLGAGGLTLNSGSHDPQTLAPSSAPIVIGNRVWCGERVTLLAGVTLGDDVVIGAGSVVTTDIPSGSVAAGVPARVLRRLDRSVEQPLWTPFDRERT